MGLCEQYATVWPASEQATAAAVCHTESSGDPGAVGDGGDSIGLWQVDTRYHPEYPKAALQDPSYNAAAALAIWTASGWTAWTTYRNGAYLAFLGSEAIPNTSADATARSGPAAPAVGLLLVAAAAAYWLLTTS